MEVPLAQLVVALPLSILSLCYPLVLRRQSPSPLASPRPSPAAIPLCAAALLPPPPQPPRCCHRAFAIALCAAATLPSPLHRSEAAAIVAAPAAAPPFVGWLLPCCPPSDFVIACRHATVDALIAGGNILYELVCTNSDNIHFSDKLCYTHKLYEFVQKIKSNSENNHV